MKNRILADELRKCLERPFPRLMLITGARQTGKTTLAQRCLSDFDYVNFDDPIIRPQLARWSHHDWYERHPRAIMDEAQKMPAIFETVKAVHDTYKDSRYTLTGSSQILLLEQVRESLAGRIAQLDLFPLTLPELLTISWESPIVRPPFIHMLVDPDCISDIRQTLPSRDPRFAQAQKGFDDYLNFGGYPLLHLHADTTFEDKREWLRNYVQTYLQRDVRDLASFRDLEPFVRAQQIAAGLTGQTINYSDLARAAGISPKTAKRFIHYLAISYQVIELVPWFRNKMKRLSKSAKLHFLDPGVQKAIIQRQGSPTGHEYESAVVAEMAKQILTNRLPAQMFHLRTNDGREIDCLVELESGFLAFEIKQTLRASFQDARHLRQLESLLDKPLIHSFVLSQDPEIKPFSDRITAVPVAWLLGGRMDF